MQDTARTDLLLDVVVVGVGGAGGNALNLIASQGLAGAQFIAADADRRALHRSEAAIHIDLDDPTASVNPLPHRVSLQDPAEIACSVRAIFAGLERHDDLRHVMFVLCGEGGLTGTVATPIVVQEAHRYGYTVVAIATHPFTFEGTERNGIAQQGIQRIDDVSDATIVIPNDYLLDMPQVDGIVRAFHVADTTIRAIVLAILHDMETTNTTAQKAADRVRRRIEHREPLDVV